MLVSIGIVLCVGSIVCAMFFVHHVRVYIRELKSGDRLVARYHKNEAFSWLIPAAAALFFGVRFVIGV